MPKDAGSMMKCVRDNLIDTRISVGMSLLGVAYSMDALYVMLIIRLFFISFAVVPGGQCLTSPPLPGPSTFPTPSPALPWHQR